MSRNARLDVALICSRLTAVPASPRARVPIGAAAQENSDRAAYQSAHCRDGHVAPLPLTWAAAWEEAERLRGLAYARAETIDGADSSDDQHWSRK